MNSPFHVSFVLFSFSVSVSALNHVSFQQLRCLSGRYYRVFCPPYSPILSDFPPEPSSQLIETHPSFNMANSPGVGRPAVLSKLKPDLSQSPVSPLKPSDGPPESPTTARALDFDSDQETGTVSTPTRTSKTDTSLPAPPPKDEPAPPMKPPRPLSAREQAENTLKEAFPSIDASVVRAVLTASGGNVEPAFNALLGMTDPDSQREPGPPAKPPRPARQAPPTSTKLSQLEADELYARQLAEQYGHGSGQQRRSRDSQGSFNEHLPGSRVGRPGASPDPDDVPWRSFIDGT